MSLAPELLFVSLALLWLCLVGWAIARLLGGSLSAPERLAWGFACGLLFSARLYEGILVAGRRPRSLVLVASGFAVIILSFLFRRPSLPRTGPGGRRGWLLGIALAVPILFFALDSIAEPMWATDYLAIWGLKAKTIFLTGLVPARLFHDPFTFWSHPEYPLLLPLTLASIASLAGRFDDQALAILYPAFQAATVFLLFGHLRRRISFEAGALAAVVAAFCLSLYRALGAGASDIPLSFAFVLAATAAFDALDEETLSASAAVRLLIASHMAVGFKQEGSLFVDLLALALLVGWRLRRRPRLLAAACLAAPAALHALIVPAVRAPIPRRDFDFTLLSPGRWNDWAERVKEVLHHLARFEIPTAGLALAAIAAILLVTGRRREDILLPVLLAQIAAYAVAASLSAFGPDWQLESAFSRTTIALVPALALVLGARAGTLFPAKT